MPAYGKDSAVDLLSAETVTVYGDVRAVAADGEVSWTEDQFGKLRYGGSKAGGSGSTRVQGEIGNVGLVWQPRFGWDISGTVVVEAQGGPVIEAGLSQAYLSYKPLSDGSFKFSARGGLMWPPISLEHGGAEWAVSETITPSAINSWIGEEVKVAGVELTGALVIGSTKVTATLGGFDVNDTAGALVTFRGWALHDRTSLATRKLPLPPLNSFVQFVNPRFSHPIKEMDDGLFSRPGYYAKLSIDLPVGVHLDFSHYDNNGNPDAVDASLEWGWRTKFNNIGLFAEPAPNWQLRGQYMHGHTVMGDDINGKLWIDTTFRSGYAMVTRQFDKGSVSARLDLFGTHNLGSAVLADDDEDGWAIAVATRRSLATWLTAKAELLHVESTRNARLRSGLAPRQVQNQLQLAMKVRW